MSAGRAKVLEELPLATFNAWAARMATNRAMSCDRCLGREVSFPAEQIPP
jgi:hypothetical protein